MTLISRGRHIATAGSLLCILMSSSAVWAEDVAATSKIQAVTVYLSGASVTRATKVKLPAGAHTVIIDDVPASAVPGSIRVEGKATGALKIGSVDTARKLLQRAESEAANATRKTIEDELERLRDERAPVEAQLQAAETQRTLIAGLANLPNRPAPPAGQASGAGEDWGRILAVIAEGTQSAARLQAETQIKLREIDRRIEDQDKKLAALPPAQSEQTEVRVALTAEQASDADLTISYQVNGAQWTPIYDARLLTGSKTDAPKLELARRASVTQRTGENWENVALKLSTARPSEGASAPELQSQSVDFEAPPPPPMPVAAAPEMRRMKLSAPGKPEGDMAETAIVDAAAVQVQQTAAEEPTAAVMVAPFEATFAIAGPQTIVGNGDQKRLLLSTETVEPQLSSRTTPKLDPQAYLYATFKLQPGTPLLPGTAYLFRDGTFIGNGSLPLLQPGAEHALGFGVDDQIKIRHAVLEDKRGETGLISTSQTDVRNYRVTLKNLHPRAIDVMVFDRVPVSQNQDIKVEATGPSVPAVKDFEDRRGVMRFDQKLEPDAEKAIEYGFKLSWPAAKSITFGP